MAIDPTSAFNAAASTLRLEDLLQVLLTELTHQNPLKPVENKDFMAQIAQFASLDASQRLNDNIEQLLLVQAISQSVGLIGRKASARIDGRLVEGVVTAMSLTDNVPRLTIRDNDDFNHVNVAIGQLENVRE